MVGLRYYRKAAGYTQSALAAELNVERAALAMWEIGRSWPSAALLPRIAQLLNCSIEDLYSCPDYTAEEEASPCLTAASICMEDTAGQPA